jgi:N-acetylneuraminic acid mutarotase
MTQPHEVPVVALLKNGKVLVADVASGPRITEVYDPVAGTWTASAGLGEVRGDARAVTLASGKVLVAGGYDYEFGYLSSVRLYDPATGTWSSAGTMNTGRGTYSATLLASGDVLFAGGWSNGTSGPGSTNVLNGAELYLP